MTSYRKIGMGERRRRGRMGFGRPAPPIQPVVGGAGGRGGVGGIRMPAGSVSTPQMSRCRCQMRTLSLGLEGNWSILERAPGARPTFRFHHKRIGEGTAEAAQTPLGRRPAAVVALSSRGIHPRTGPAQPVATR
jgi:hypothetical protein